MKVSQQRSRVSQQNARLLIQIPTEGKNQNTPNHISKSNVQTSKALHSSTSYKGGLTSVPTSIGNHISHVRSKALQSVKSSQTASSLMASKNDNNNVYINSTAQQQNSSSLSSPKILMFGAVKQSAKQSISGVKKRENKIVAAEAAHINAVNRTAQKKKVLNSLVISTTTSKRSKGGTTVKDTFNQQASNSISNNQNQLAVKSQKNFGANFSSLTTPHLLSQPSLQHQQPNKKIKIKVEKKASLPSSTVYNQSSSNNVHHSRTNTVCVQSRSQQMQQTAHEDEQDEGVLGVDPTDYQINVAPLITQPTEDHLSNNLNLNSHRIQTSSQHLYHQPATSTTTMNTLQTFETKTRHAPTISLNLMDSTTNVGLVGSSGASQLSKNFANHRRQNPLDFSEQLHSDPHLIGTNEEEMQAAQEQQQILIGKQLSAGQTTPSRNQNLKHFQQEDPPHVMQMHYGHERQLSEPQILAQKMSHSATNLNQSKKQHMNIFGTMPHQSSTPNQNHLTNVSNGKTTQQLQRTSIGSSSVQVYQTSGNIQSCGVPQKSRHQPQNINQNNAGSQNFKQPKSHTASVSSLNRSNRSANRSGNNSALAMQQRQGNDKGGGSLEKLQPHTASLVECLNSIKSQRFFKKPPQDSMVAEQMISPPRKTFNYQSNQKESKKGNRTVQNSAQQISKKMLSPSFEKPPKRSSNNNHHPHLFRQEDHQTSQHNQMTNKSTQRLSVHLLGKPKNKKIVQSMENLGIDQGQALQAGSGAHPADTIFGKEEEFIGGSHRKNQLSFKNGTSLKNSESSKQFQYQPGESIQNIQNALNKVSSSRGGSISSPLRQTNFVAEGPRQVEKVIPIGLESNHEISQIRQQQSQTQVNNFIRDSPASLRHNFATQSANNQILGQDQEINATQEDQTCVTASDVDMINFSLNLQQPQHPAIAQTQNTSQIFGRQQLLRQENQRIEKTLKLRQKVKHLEEMLQTAVLQNQNLREKSDEQEYNSNLKTDQIEDLKETILNKDRAIGALQAQLAQDRIQLHEKFANGIGQESKKADELRQQVFNLQRFTEDLKLENEKISMKRNELEERISELELSKLDQERELLRLKGQYEDALQAQESYKGIVKRIQMTRTGAEFQSPLSFGENERKQKQLEAKRLSQRDALTARTILRQNQVNLPRVDSLGSNAEISGDFNQHQFGEYSDQASSMTARADHKRNVLKNQSQKAFEFEVKSLLEECDQAEGIGKAMDTQKTAHFNKDINQNQQHSPLKHAQTLGIPKSRRKQARFVDNQKKIVQKEERGEDSDLRSISSFIAEQEKADSDLVFLDTLKQAEISNEPNEKLLEIPHVKNLKMNRRDTFGPPSNVNCRTPSAKNQNTTEEDSLLVNMNFDGAATNELNQVQKFKERPSWQGQKRSANLNDLDAVSEKKLSHILQHSVTNFAEQQDDSLVDNSAWNPSTAFGAEAGEIKTTSNRSGTTTADQKKTEIQLQKGKQLKRIQRENAQLKQQLKQMKAVFESDKILKQMKKEADSCLQECQAIMNALEDKVQQSMFSDLVAEGEGSNPFEKSNSPKVRRTTQLISKEEQELRNTMNMASPSRFSTLTMDEFQQTFLKEMNEKALQADVISLRDLQKIHKMLTLIYRHVLRLANDQQRNESFQQTQ